MAELGNLTVLYCPLSVAIVNCENPHGKPVSHVRRPNCAYPRGFYGESCMMSRLQSDSEFSASLMPKDCTFGVSHNLCHGTGRLFIILVSRLSRGQAVPRQTQDSLPRN